MPIILRLWSIGCRGLMGIIIKTKKTVSRLILMMDSII